MVEVLEYSFVFLATSMLVGFSIAAAVSFQGVSYEIENRAAFSSLIATAWGAMEHGNSSVALKIANSSVYCAGGVLTFSSPYYSAVADMPTNCDFAYPRLDGQHLFGFASVGGWLELGVS
jgi:hypothetical protein